MKQAIIRTVIFAVIIVLLEIGLGYYKANADGGTYSLSNSNVGLIGIFILAYFVLQVFKFRRLGN